MNDILNICSRMYALHQLPLSLVDRDGHILQSWPEMIEGKACSIGSVKLFTQYNVGLNA